MADIKVDLTLLKRLVTELETTLHTAEEIKAEIKHEHADLVVEASKAAGLAAGVAQEAGLLVMDIHAWLTGSQASKSGSQFLEKLMGSLKGPGNAN